MGESRRRWESSEVAIGWPINCQSLVRDFDKVNLTESVSRTKRE